MIYRKQRQRPGAQAGFFYLQDEENRRVSGSSDGEYILLSDEQGNKWNGVAERQSDDTVRYRFRDTQGNYISGVSDGYGVILRDQKGHTWRGFVD